VSELRTKNFGHRNRSCRPQGRLRGFEGIDDRSSCPLYGHCPSPPAFASQMPPPLRAKGRLCDTALYTCLSRRAHRGCGDLCGSEKTTQERAAHAPAGVISDFSACRRSCGAWGWRRRPWFLPAFSADPSALWSAWWGFPPPQSHTGRHGSYNPHRGYPYP